MLRAFDHGLVAGVGAAAVFGLLTDPFGLTWGLLAVGFIGGMVIGAAVARGAWAGVKHFPNRRVQTLAAGIGVGSWVAAFFIAYLASQALIPQSSVGLLERLSAAGMAEYFLGQMDANSVGQVGGLLSLAYLAWRWAR
jgi:hypothetical protein